MRAIHGVVQSRAEIAFKRARKQDACTAFKTTKHLLAVYEEALICGTVVRTGKNAMGRLIAVLPRDGHIQQSNIEMKVATCKHCRHGLRHDYFEELAVPSYFVYDDKCSWCDRFCTRFSSIEKRTSILGSFSIEVRPQLQIWYFIRKARVIETFDLLENQTHFFLTISRYQKYIGGGDGHPWSESEFRYYPCSHLAFLSGSIPEKLTASFRHRAVPKTK
jgi:hypothetical protein